MQVLTPNGLQVLTALRNAAVIRRAPRPLAKDGLCHWWTLGELVEDGWLPDDTPLARLSSAAHGLRKHKLAAGRTQFTVTRYAITDTGRIRLASLEERAGVTDAMKAFLVLAQARYDLEAARERREKAMEAAEAAHAALGYRDPGDLVLDALKAGVR